MPFPDIDPVAFSIGSFPIRWYALAYMVGLFVAMLRAHQLVKRYPDFGLTPAQVDDAVLCATLGVILGGRLGSVLFYNLEYYLKNPVDVFKMWEGGMSFHGGLIGVVLALFIYSRLNRVSWLRLGDLAACVASIGLFLGRLANFVNGELWGRPTALPWGVIFPDPRAGGVPRHPSQLYEAALEGVLLFAVVSILVTHSWVRSRAGILSGIFLLLYSISRTLVEQVREPDPGLGFIFGEITRGQALSFPMFVGGVYLLITGWRAHVVERSSPSLGTERA